VREANERILSKKVEENEETQKKKEGRQVTINQ
jgi:hypothetical protein